MGAESGVGTTHIAIALTSFFNAGGANALYREIQSEKREKISNVVEQIGRSREAECEEDIVICRNFRGSESIGSGEDTLIFDYGAAVEEACMEEADYSTRSESVFVEAGGFHESLANVTLCTKS